MDSVESGLKLLLQGFFIFGLTAFFLNWLGSKFSKWKKSESKSKTEDPDVVRQYRDQQTTNIQQIQDAYNERAQEYKDTILLPRQEAKRKKKEEEFDKILGHSWKGSGQGHSLGGDVEEDAASSDVPEGRRAANHRKRLEEINQEVAAAVAAEAIAEAKKKLREKRVIQLPEEPSEDDPDAIEVKFRTPLGTTCSRRFHKNDTVQCLLDFITTKGFSQKKYNISTSYPRHTLMDATICLTELSFGQKVALNIEEKE